MTRVPRRGPFRLPEPWNTLACRLTNEDDGEVRPVGYTYWPQISASAGRPWAWAFLSIADAYVLFRIDKETLEAERVRELPFSGWGEGSYFSLTDPDLLYVSRANRLLGHDVAHGTTWTVAEVPGLARQWHTCADGRVHSLTLDGRPAVVRNGTVEGWAPLGDYDECQIDKSGRWLLIKERLEDGRDGNRIIDLETGEQTRIHDAEFAVGHSDMGWGYVVGEEDQTNPGGVFRVWQFPKYDRGPVYATGSWERATRYASHPNARPGDPAGQVALFSSIQDDIVLAPLDGTMRRRPVAPSLCAPSDDYWQQPRATLDPSGSLAIWTANLGTGRLDAFVVKIPSLDTATRIPSGEHMPRPTYDQFVFTDARIIARAWLARNPTTVDPNDVEGSVQHIFEKAMEMAWRLLADEKPMRQVLEEIGVNPDEYLSPPNPSETPRGPARAGVVRLHGRAAVDDTGTHHFFGTSLFWMMQGFRTDRDRAVQNMRWCAESGLDYFRFITQVNWPGRSIDPRTPDHEAVMADVIDTAGQLGLRVQPTLVGDPTNLHQLIAERYASVARTRAERIVYTEMVNEWRNDSKATMAEMQVMARKVRAGGVRGLLGLSEPRALTAAERSDEAQHAKPANEMQDAMAAVDAHVFIEHTDRGAGDLDWRLVRQAYDFKAARADNTGSNQEPPGPASSVRTLEDPRRLALMAWLSWMCGCGFFTLHLGSGVTGLNDPARGRQANLWEVPRIDEILRAIHFVRARMPEGAQNWRVVNNGGSSSPHPLRLDPAVGAGFWEGSAEGSVNKNYFSLAPDGRRFIGVLLGVKGFGTAETRDVLCGVAGRNLRVEATDPVTRQTIVKDLTKGKEWILSGRRDADMGYIVTGEFT